MNDPEIPLPPHGGAWTLDPKTGELKPVPPEKDPSVAVPDDAADAASDRKGKT